MIGENIKKLRLARGLKQSELAEKLHVAQNTISYWESGRTEPNIGAIDMLCDVLNCSRSDLIGVEKPSDVKTDMFIKISFDKKEPSVKVLSGELTENEEIFLERYRNCDDETKGLLNRIIEYQQNLNKKKDPEQ